jgi:hypothetical protein
MQPIPPRLKLAISSRALNSPKNIKSGTGFPVSDFIPRNIFYFVISPIVNEFELDIESIRLCAAAARATQASPRNFR